MVNAPKFLELAETLKKMIASGQWPEGSFLPSIRKLQDRHGLARNTVVAAIRVLADEGIVAREGASRQGYRIIGTPEDVASAGQESIQNAVKFVLPFNYWNYVGGMLMDSIEKVFSENHMSFLFSNHRNDIEVEDTILARVEASSHTILRAMLLMSTVSYEHPHLERLERIRELVPVVLVDRYIEGFDAHFVGIDNRKIGRDSVKYLERCGHRRIGFFGGFGRISTVWERLSGAREAADRTGLEMRDEWIIMQPFLFESYDSMIHSGDALAERYLELKERPDAIICGSDKLAAGLMRALSETDVRVPEDLSLIACDDDHIQRNSLPRTITSWAYPYEDLASEVMEMVRLLEKDPGRPVKRVDLNPVFVEGGTVG